MSVKFTQQRKKKASIFVKAQHLHRVTTKVPIRIRIRGGSPASTWAA
jgi:hypothetical protein